MFSIYLLKDLLYIIVIMIRKTILLLYLFMGIGNIYAQSKLNMKYNELTPEEEAVILHKGTEYPGTGELLHNKEKGMYVCKQCDAPLYASESKFDSNCGWPSFDDEIEGAIEQYLMLTVDGQKLFVHVVRGTLDTSSSMKDLLLKTHGIVLTPSQ